MSRIVLFVLALFVIWRVLASLGKRAASAGHGADSFSRFSPRRRRRRLDERRTPSGGVAEELLPCSTCGTFVPSGRAVIDDRNGVFCSEHCREQLRGGGSREG
jgi:hypothetical protein